MPLPTYTLLSEGEIIRTAGVKDEKKNTNDQLLTENGWLDSPSHWNGCPVPDCIQFRRPNIQLPL
jgi:hypothetical protein